MIVIFANEKQKEIYIMATAIKAIPTLRGEDAICFREEMEANERAFLNSKIKKDRESDPFIMKMREMLKRSGFYS